MIDFALALLLQGDASAEIEKLSQAYAKLQTVRVAYEVRAEGETEVVGIRVTCTLDRPGRRAYLLSAGTKDGVEREIHFLMEDLITRTWTEDGTTAILMDLGVALKPLQHETVQVETELRKLLPPALALPVVPVLVPGFFMDLGPATADERAYVRFAVGMFPPGGRVPYAAFLTGATLADDPADSVFRVAETGKTWRIDRATGIIRSLKLEAKGATTEFVLTGIEQPAAIPELKRPATFREETAPLELVDPALRATAASLSDLLGIFRGTWAGLPADVAPKVPPLLRRWILAYADGLRVHRIRLWVSGYVKQIRKDNPLYPLAAYPDGPAGTLLETLQKGAEQERAQVTRDLNRLAGDLKAEKPTPAAQALDDAVRDATSPDAVIPALPAWTKERMKELLLQELERAKPK